MDSTKRVIKFQNYDLRKSVGTFWMIMGLINILAYIVIIVSNGTTRVWTIIDKVDLISIAGSNPIPIVIFFIVYGIMMYYEDFALALSFGTTRKDFYNSVIVNNILVSLIFGATQGILQLLDKYIIEYLGYKPIVDFGIFNIASDNIFLIILTLAGTFLTIISITNLLGVLQFKFGYKLWIGLGIVLIIGLGKTFARFMTWFLGRLFTGNTIDTILTQIAITIICYSLGYFLIKRTNIKK